MDTRAPGGAPFALRRCSEAPLRLEGPPGAQHSRGCVVRYDQQLSDPAQIAALGKGSVERRYLVYIPRRPLTPAPLVFMFPGFGASAEAAALYYTHTRFEQLADLHGFVVVYGNGLPFPPPGETSRDATPRAGYLQGCFAEHTEEGIDVQYARQIVSQLEAELVIDRSRIYATGLSAGGGMAFQLALEAPDLVAAIAPVAPLPFQPSGPWLQHCHPKAGHAGIPVAMLAATHDRFITYAGGPSPEYPQIDYPGMEETRDAWLRALGVSDPPEVELLPDRVQEDSYEPHTGLRTSLSNANAIQRARAARSSGTTKPSAWGTGGRTRRRAGAACGNASARRIRTSTSRITRGSSLNGTPDESDEAVSRALPCLDTPRPAH